jgi:hypothetical protein
MLVGHFRQRLQAAKLCAGQKKLEVASVIAWDCLRTTFALLLHRHDIVVMHTDHSGLGREQQVQIKKLFAAMIYEMDSCFEFWAGLLKEKRVRDRAIRQARREFKAAFKIAGLATKRMRNAVDLPFGEFIAKPEVIIASYQALDEIPLKAFHVIFDMANHCGFKMRQKVMGLSE